MGGVPEPGTRAPEFTLPEAYGAEVRLSEVLSGSHALINFFPSDWGAICTLNIKTLNTLYPKFRELGVEVMAISTNSTFCHSAWKMHLGVEYPILADFDGRVSGSYGVLVGEEGYMMGRSKRSVFIIDRRGVVRYKWVTEDPAIEPDYDLLIETCSRLGGGLSLGPAQAGRTPESSNP